MESVTPVGELEIQLVDPLQGSEWESLAGAHPDFSVFHTSAWARVLVGTYQHRPFYLHLRSARQAVALLPFMEVRSPLTGRRGVSLPFSDFCPLLPFASLDPAALLRALHGFASERGWRYFEIRGRSPLLPSVATPSVEFHGHQLDLQRSPADLFAACTPATRRAVRKAERSGVIVEITRDSSAMFDYYRLHERTRRRHGAPPQPRAFFLRIQEELIQAGHGFVALARRGARTIAGAVFLHAGSQAIYKFGASDEREQALRANNLVMWRAIESLTSQRFATLHFGRTSLGGESLRRFKLGWGAAESRVAYFQMDTASRAWMQARDQSAGWHTRIFSRLPLALNRAIGGALYPHLD